MHTCCTVHLEYVHVQVPMLGTCTCTSHNIALTSYHSNLVNSLLNPLVVPLLELSPQHSQSGVQHLPLHGPTASPPQDDLLGMQGRLLYIPPFCSWEEHRKWRMRYQLRVTSSAWSGRIRHTSANMHAITMPVCTCACMAVHQ